MIRIPKEKKIKRYSSKPNVPSRAISGSSGYDLFSCEKKINRLFSQELIKTDLFIAILLDHYGGIAECSGLILKQEIGVGTGVLDSDFRVIVAIILFNHSKSPYEVNLGHRILQMIFEKLETVKFVKLTTEKKLSITERDSNSFGSSGV